MEDSIGKSESVDADSNSNSFNVFDFPEVKDISFALFDKLLSESGRGAILVGMEYINDHLGNLIASILPNKSKKYHKQILEYPGPLSSFSARIEMCYAFRYIQEPIYVSLHALRKIRNEAAHSSSEFLFPDKREKLDKIFSFIPSYPTFIRERAMTLMVNYKIEGLKSVFQENNLTIEQQKEQAEMLLSNKEMIKKWEDEQLPHWELIFGLTILCGIISHRREQILAQIAKKKSNTPPI